MVYNRPLCVNSESVWKGKKTNKDKERMPKNQGFFLSEGLLIVEHNNKKIIKIDTK